MLKAPWTEDQVASLAEYQNCGLFHPFTSSDGAVLIPTPMGWTVKDFGAIVQDWCHDWMADWSWKKQVEQMQERFPSMKVGNDE